jgi:hypothetical protein
MFVHDINEISGNRNGDLGLKIYKAKADLSNWSELTLVPSLTTIDDYTVKPIDCK